MTFRPSIPFLCASFLICAAITAASQKTAFAQASPKASPPAGFQGVLTYHNDNPRTGQNLLETTLTPGTVNSSTFGKLISYPVDGLVYAQPLYVPDVKIPRKGVHNVVYVATEHDSVYAFDADGLSSDSLWHSSFINPRTGLTTIPAADTGANLVGPEIGITSTPVIDGSAGTIYVVAATKNKAGVYAQRLHALSIATGAEKSGARLITATIHAGGDGSNAGILTFSPLHQLQRAALLLAGGTIYVAFASHGDVDPYHGWVFAYSATGLRPLAVFNDTPAGSQGGIWQSGNGPAVDIDGNVFVASGNGTFDAQTGGPDYGDSLIELVRSKSKLVVSDYFTPSNQAIMAADDLDFGSSGPILLPDQSSGPAHLAVAGDELGTVYIIDRDQLGGFSPDGDQIVQELPSEFSEGILSTPAYFNNRIYFGAVANPLVSFVLSSGQIQTDGSVSFSSHSFGYPGTTPSISANGADNAIVWAIDSSAYSSNGPAVLYAFDASTLNELYDSTQAGSRDVAGPAVKFTVPTIANGKVYVGTQSELDVYGSL